MRLFRWIFAGVIYFALLPVMFLRQRHQILAAHRPRFNDLPRLTEEERAAFDSLCKHGLGGNGRECPFGCVLLARDVAVRKAEREEFYGG